MRPNSRQRLIVLAVAAAAAGGVAQSMPPRAHAAPAPEVEYVFDVQVRRHYNFPGNDAVGYGYGICHKVSQNQSYAQVMGDVKREVSPSDEFVANYLVSYAVSILCPAQIWQLRQSSEGYRPPGGETGPGTYY
ncbi:DUF732 domain-containing protein [Mycobacterium sp. Aquia_216]|uniref:DUF732 domain-containing protein n=1 Tax=Mycobacterium sp. Aquia_216 TaxID=2991729 RepID=UPI00227B34AE|nr:DUF732 domain-containing protein [Mycobacterium sp. Aquia_216]WAJ44318.1 DUF732 domain-containing protein [Mycobacterium sp. Aquia_216]